MDNYLPNNLNLGLQPDKPDERDYRFGDKVARSIDNLPTSITLQKHSSRVEDQGDLSSCTGNALTSAYETLMNLKVPKYHGELSRLFVYYNERDLEGSVAKDQGATLRSGIKTLKTNGVCLENYWPYLDSLWDKKPNEDAYRDAQKRTISTYERIQTLDEMRICLARHQPFVFGIPIFEDTQPTPRNNWTFQDVGRRLLGYHAMTCMGYDDLNSRFLVKNSWGTSWGHEGWCFVGYEFMRSEALDCWTFEIQLNEKTPEAVIVLPWWQRLFYRFFHSYF